MFKLIGIKSGSHFNLLLLIARSTNCVKLYPNLHFVFRNLEHNIVGGVPNDNLHWQKITQFYQANHYKIFISTKKYISVFND